MGVPVYRTASTVPQYTDISVYRYTPMSYSACQIEFPADQCTFCFPRFEQFTEWSSPPTHEGPVCGAMSYSACQIEFPADQCTFCFPRFEQFTEWTSPPTHEGLVCGAMSYSTRQTEFPVDQFSFCFPRFEQFTERSSPPTHEGPVCGAMSHSTCQTEFPTAVSTHVDGPLSIGSKWFTDFSQPGSTLFHIPKWQTVKMPGMKKFWELCINNSVLPNKLSNIGIKHDFPFINIR